MDLLLLPAPGMINVSLSVLGKGEENLDAWTYGSLV